MLETESLQALLERYARAREQHHRADYAERMATVCKEKDEARAAMAAVTGEIERRIEQAAAGIDRADPFNPFGSGPVPVVARDGERLAVLAAELSQAAQYRRTDDPLTRLLVRAAAAFEALSERDGQQ